MKLITPTLLFAIMLLGASLRSYKLHEPLGDWHSWRQADTASVAREYVKAGKIDLFHPRYHDLSNIPSGLDNPEGWRFVEFPLRDALHAQLVMWFPTVGLVEWGRIISIIASTLTTGLIFLIVRHLSGARAGIFSALIFAILPYNIFYGRVILPEPVLVFCAMLSLFAFFKFWDSGKLSWYLLSLTTLVLATLIKPTALTTLLPMLGYALPSIFKHLRQALLLFFLPILTVIPYLLWRHYLSAFPEGIPANSWLFNSNGIRFKGAWFRWLFGERIAKMILGYWGLIPLGFGLLRLGKHNKETFTYLGLIIASLSYLTIIATGNVQHDYYQIQIIPTLVILTGVGIDYAITLKKGILNKLTVSATLVVTMLLSLALSWYELRGFFWVNNRAMVEAGRALDQLAPAEALVIAPYMGDTAFLFQTNRRGWPIGGAIEEKIKAGANYYVTTTKDQEFQELKTKYTLIQETADYAIIKL